MALEVKSFLIGPMHPSQGRFNLMHLDSQPSLVIGPKHKIPLSKKQRLSLFSISKLYSLGISLLIRFINLLSILSVLNSQSAQTFFSDKIISLFSSSLIIQLPNNLEGGGHPGIIPSISI
ncbi:hypothetical protein ES703_87555 [subsurface metagenome]